MAELDPVRLLVLAEPAVLAEAVVHLAVKMAVTVVAQKAAKAKEQLHESLEILTESSTPRVGRGIRAGMGTEMDQQILATEVPGNTYHQQRDWVVPVL